MPNSLHFWSLVQLKAWKAGINETHCHLWHEKLKKYAVQCIFVVLGRAFFLSRSNINYIASERRDKNRIVDAIAMSDFGRMELTIKQKRPSEFLMEQLLYRIWLPYFAGITTAEDLQKLSDAILQACSKSENSCVILECLTTLLLQLPLPQAGLMTLLLCFTSMCHQPDTCQQFLFFSDQIWAFASHCMKRKEETISVLQRSCLPCVFWTGFIQGCNRWTLGDLASIGGVHAG